MKFSSFFLLLFIINISLILSSKDEFIPLKPGNGILNQPYNHTSNEKNLFFIFLNLRHGARSPLSLNKKHNDILGGKWKSNSELTSLGIKQHYIIGNLNKERYSSFIKEEYDPKEIKIYSTPFPRTIMSVASELLGFYNNNSYPLNYNFSDIDFENKDIEDINKIIIPPIQLFSFNEKNNHFDSTFKNHFECKYMRNQVKENWGIPHKEINSIITNFTQEYSEIIEKEFKNINLNLLKTPKYFDNFCDVFLSIYFDESRYYLLQKISKYGKNINKIKEICDDFLYKQFIYIRNGGIAEKNPSISISPIINQIINWMKSRTYINNNFKTNYNEPKLVIYSAHDSNLFQMQAFLKICFNIEVEKTEFASTQLMELRKYGNEFYVEIYYNDKLKMNITLKEFEQRINENILSEKEINHLCYNEGNNFIKFMYILIFILIIILCYEIRKIYAEKKSDSDSLRVVQIA
jgi:hypothetical protein